MAAGNFTVYTSAKLQFMNGNQDWDTDAHYCMLLTSSYTPALTHSTRADLDANEVTDTDYVKQDMAGESVTDNVGTIQMDASDVSFGASVTITARYAAVVVGTVAGTATGDALVGYVELDTAGDVSSSNGSFDIIWNASGLFTLS